jgi:ABC-2 type transport system ATP-binding protein
MAPVNELRRTGSALEVKVEGAADRYVRALAGLPFAPNVLAEGGRLRVMLEAEEQAPDVVACLVGAGARVRSAVPAQRPLEEVYLELIREGGA